MKLEALDQSGLDLVSVTGSQPTGLLHAVLDASPDCVMLIECDGTVSYISENGRCAMSLDSFELLAGTAWTSLYPNSMRDALDELLQKASAGEAVRQELWMDEESLGSHWWLFQLSPVTGPDGQTDRVLCVSRPLCRTEASETIRREADHRIKNSLAAVSSLLRMQARSHDMPEIRDALTDASHRVMSVAHVHGHLDTSEMSDDAEVSAQDFITPLITELTDSLSETEVTLLHEIEPMTLSARQATALGLIATEAVINALRHGFGHDPNGGMVHVSLKADEKGVRTLSVGNTGKTLPARFDWNAAKGLGRRVIDLYARSLGGTVKMTNAPIGGVRLSVTF